MPLLPTSSVKPPNPGESLAPEERLRWDFIMGAIALAVLILDQITKMLVVNHFKGAHLFDVVPVIGNIIVFQYLGNSGAAFSSFEQSPVLLGFLILVACGVIGWLYWSMRPRANPWLRVAFGLIAGGAVGNLLDRIRLGYVVDFIHFQIPPKFSFFVFNVADAGISVGVLLLAVLFWTLPREAEPTLAEPGTPVATTSSEAPRVPAVKAGVSPEKLAANKDALTQTASGRISAPTGSARTPTPNKKRKRR